MSKKIKGGFMSNFMKANLGMFSNSGLSYGLSVEQLKRVHALNARFGDVGFPPGLEFGLNKRITSLNINNVVVQGDIEVSY